MKRLSFLATAALVSSLALVSTSCEDEAETITVTETETVTVDSSLPQGDVTVVGTENTFTDQNDAGSAGKAAIILDADGNYFLRLDEDFTTNTGTGTVSVFLAKSDEFQSGMDGVGSQMAVGAISSTGETFFGLGNTAPGSDYTHVILWCGTVGIPFGNAQVQ